MTARGYDTEADPRDGFGIADGCEDCGATVLGDIDDHTCAEPCGDCDLIECECGPDDCNAFDNDSDRDAESSAEFDDAEPGDDDAFAGPVHDGGCDDVAYDGEYFTGGDE